MQKTQRKTVWKHINIVTGRMQLEADSGVGKRLIMELEGGV